MYSVEGEPLDFITQKQQKRTQINVAAAQYFFYRTEAFLFGRITKNKVMIPANKEHKETYRKLGQ